MCGLIVIIFLFNFIEKMKYFQNMIFFFLENKCSKFSVSSLLKCYTTFIKGSRERINRQPPNSERCTNFFFLVHLKYI